MSAIAGLLSAFAAAMIAWFSHRTVKVTNRQAKISEQQYVLLERDYHQRTSPELQIQPVEARWTDESKITHSYYLVNPGLTPMVILHVRTRYWHAEKEFAYPSKKDEVHIEQLDMLPTTRERFTIHGAKTFLIPPQAAVAVELYSIIRDKDAGAADAIEWVLLEISSRVGESSDVKKTRMSIPIS